MTEQEVISNRMVNWQRLAFLTEKAGTSFRSLTIAETEEFIRLYRQASSDLSFLSTRANNPDILNILNTIVTNAYTCLYRPKPKRLSANLSEILFRSADTTRRHSRLIGVAAAIFFVAAFLVPLLTSAFPQTRSILLPNPGDPNAVAWRDRDLSARSLDSSAAMTAFYATNNPRVGLTSAGLAIPTLGVGPAYILWSNGLMVGGLAQFVQPAGSLPYLLTSIFPHGVPEIGGFFFTAAAGFLCGISIISPGRRRRAEALWANRGDIGTLLVTGLVMIFSAAPIEGFFSFNPNVPQPLKVAAGCLFLSGFWIFFSTYGKRRSVEEAEAKQRSFAQLMALRYGSAESSS